MTKKHSSGTLTLIPDFTVQFINCFMTGTSAQIEDLECNIYAYTCIRACM